MGNQMTAQELKEMFLFVAGRVVENEEHLTEIDGKIGAQGVSEEVLYFRRFSYIKEKMNHQFVNLDQGFLDRLIDDYVYDSVFEGKSE